MLASLPAFREMGTSTVTATWQHLDPFITTLTIDGEEIETTPEHPFFVLLCGWVLAGDLRVGDSVRLREGSSGVVARGMLMLPTQATRYHGSNSHGIGSIATHNRLSPQMLVTSPAQLYAPPEADRC